MKAGKLVLGKFTTAEEDLQVLDRIADVVEDKQGKLNALLRETREIVAEETGNERQMLEDARRITAKLRSTRKTISSFELGNNMKVVIQKGGLCKVWSVDGGHAELLRFTELVEVCHKSDKELKPIYENITSTQKQNFDIVRNALAKFEIPEKKWKLGKECEVSVKDNGVSVQIYGNDGDSISLDDGRDLRIDEVRAFLKYADKVCDTLLLVEAYVKGIALKNKFVAVELEEGAKKAKFFESLSGDEDGSD